MHHIKKRHSLKFKVINHAMFYMQFLLLFIINKKKKHMYVLTWYHN